MMNDPAKMLSVQDYMQSQLSPYTDILQTLCAIDSESTYKPGLDAMALALEQHMQCIGMETKIVQNERYGNDLLGTVYGDGDATIVLLGHTDTVYPTGTAALRPLRIEGNRLYGPGVSDMKGCLLSALYAIDGLLRQHYRPFKELRLLCVSDEEIDDRHSEALIAQTFQGSQAVLVLESAGENGNIVSARKGLTRYKLNVQGHAAHAGSDFEKGRNAIVEAAHQILQLYNCNGSIEGVTINPGVITGGTAVNVVPDYAEALLDVRFLHLEDKRQLERRWQDLLCRHVVPDTTVSLEPVSLYKEQPMTCTPASLELIQKAQEAAHYLGMSIDHELRGGGSDASYASRYGLPVIDGLGPIGGLDHSPNEYLRLDTIPQRTALLAGLIASIDHH